MRYTDCAHYVHADYGIDYQQYGQSFLVSCSVSCDASALESSNSYMYGCYNTAITYDSSVCGFAHQANIPPRTPFILDILPREEVQNTGCENNSIVSDSYHRQEHTVYRVRPCEDSTTTAAPVTAAPTRNCFSNENFLSKVLSLIWWRLHVIEF